MRSCVRISRTNCLFIFQLENILRSYLNNSTSYGRLTDFKSFLGLLLVITLKTQMIKKNDSKNKVVAQISAKPSFCKQIEIS